MNHHVHLFNMSVSETFKTWKRAIHRKDDTLVLPQILKAPVGCFEYFYSLTTLHASCSQKSYLDQVLPFIQQAQCLDIWLREKYGARLSH